MGNSKSHGSFESLPDSKKLSPAKKNGPGIYPHEIESRNSCNTEESTSGIYPHCSSLDDPVLFHRIHGINVRISGNGEIASRTNSFCYAIAFTSRPILVEERICFKLKRVDRGWSGVMRFGFTSVDPGTRHPNDLPRYACPDLTNEPGYWAKAMPEKFAKQDNLLSFYVNPQGCVFYSINDKLEGMFFNGVDVSSSLWVLVDIYGNTTSLEIMNQNAAQSERQEMIIPYQLQVRPSEERVHMSLPPNMESMVRLHFNITGSMSPIGFSATMGQQLRCRNRKLLMRKEREIDSAIAFTNTALKSGQTVYMYCAEAKKNPSPVLEQMGFGIGITTCDPSTILVSDLPFDSSMLLDRDEYWIIFKELEPPEECKYFSLTIEHNGSLSYTRQGGNKVTLFYMDVSQPLYLVLDLCATISAVAMVGMSTTSGPMEYFDVPRDLGPTEGDITQLQSLEEDLFANINLIGSESISNSSLQQSRQLASRLFAAEPSTSGANNLQPIRTLYVESGSHEESNTDSEIQIAPIDVQQSAEQSDIPTEPIETTNPNTSDPEPASYSGVDEVEASEEATVEAAQDNFSMGDIAAPFMLGALSWLGHRVVNRLRANSEDIPDAGGSTESGSSSSTNESRERGGENEDQFYIAPEDSGSSDDVSDDDDVDHLEEELNMNSRLLDMLNRDLTELLFPPENMEFPEMEVDVASDLPQEPRPVTMIPEQTKAETENDVEVGKDVSQNKECVVCCDNTVNAVVYTCGHACMCYACGQVILRQRRPTCPICRAKVKDIIRMYHA